MDKSQQSNKIYFTILKMKCGRSGNLNLKNYLISQVQACGAKIYLNTEATPALLEREKVDAIIVAVGAEPVTPLIPGIENSNVIQALDVFGNEDTLGKRIAITRIQERGSCCHNKMFILLWTDVVVVSLLLL